MPRLTTLTSLSRWLAEAGRREGPPTPSRGRRLGTLALRVVLGLFIVWQLWFLLLANFVPWAEKAVKEVKQAPALAHFFPKHEDEEEERPAALRTLVRVTDRWSEATAQPQSWGLFAPNVVSTFGIPVVELRWDDDPLAVTALSRTLAPLAAADEVQAAALWIAAEQARAAPICPPVMLPSDNAPADLRRYFRVGKFRLRRYEGQLDLSQVVPEDKTRGQVVDGWRADLEEKIQKHGAAVRAYLQWRRDGYLRAHPELPPPRQVILYMQPYRIPRPGTQPWFWDLFDLQPVARWQPGARWEPGLLPVEMFNPVVERYESVRE